MFEIYVGGPKKRECRVSLSVKGGLNFTGEAVNKYNPARCTKAQILFDKDAGIVGMKFDKQAHPFLKCQMSGGNSGLVIQLNGFASQFNLKLPLVRIVLDLVFDDLNGFYTFKWPL